MAGAKETVSVVTGANSGLGLGIAQRLIDTFLSSHPSSSSHTLKIVITTRSNAKAESAISSLRKHLKKSSGGGRGGGETRVSFEYVLMDLCSLYSVTAASKELLRRYKHIDHFFCNAGLSGVVGIDWLMAAKVVPLHFVEELNYGSFRIQSVGELTKGHDRVSSKGTTLSAGEKMAGVDGDMEKTAVQELGVIFCANVFGHYYLLHEIMPLLHSTNEGEASRIIWIGSLTSTTNNPFSVEDLQGLKSKLCYDSSKRLTEVLVRSSESSSTSAAVAGFNAIEPSNLIISQNEEETKNGSNPPVHLLTHPGVVSTSFVDIHPVMAYLWLIGMYLARMLGSKWQTIYPYNGAAAPVHAATEPLNEVKGKKWGSSCDRLGHDSVVESEIAEGWEDIAEQCWKEMEELRGQWRVRIENS